MSIKQALTYALFAVYLQNSFKMAGVVPFANNSSTRKQWNIRDKRIRRLRSQLAEDGCPESQLALAKQLLHEKSSGDQNDNKENARLGVFWLMQASEQGCQEATEMLQNCLDTAEGITEHNYLDVKSCLNTPLNEKLARRAAREMFLSLSSGQDFITTEQLRRRMRSFEQDRNNQQCAQSVDTEWKDRGDHWGEKLTEDHLEEAASTYTRGELPLVQRILTITDPRNRELTELPYLHRATRHPLRSLQFAYDSLLNLAWSFAYPRVSVILLIFLLCPTDNFLNILPMTFFYSSFFAMIVATLQMLQSKREYSHFRVWSQLFLSYDRVGHLNTEDPEFIYIKKNLRPFAVFFLGLLINLAVYPLISELWIPQSEIAIMSFAFTFATLYKFCQGFDCLMLLSFGLHVLAKYPYETDGVVRQTWRFLDFLPDFASQVVGSGVEFCLNFRGVFYLLIPGIFIKLASRQSWRGTYKILIPHCVTLAWWQVAVLSCQGATLYGLIRSTLALVGMILFLPIVSLVTIFLPVLAVLTRITEPGLTPFTMTTTLLATFFLLLGIYFATPRIQYLSQIQMALAVAAAAVLVYPAINEHFIQPYNATNGLQIQTTLKWDQYVAMCPRHKMLKATSLETQAKCSHFSGLRVHWEGTVVDIEVTAVSNRVESLLSFLPDFLKSLLTCQLGEKYDKTCNTAKEMCDLLKTLRTRNQRCHLSQYNRYDLTITLHAALNQWFGDPHPPQITLEIDETLRNFTQQLQRTDKIWFSGVLTRVSSLGPDVRISADELGCVNCQNPNLTSAKIQNLSVITADSLKKALNQILNFILNPVVVFR